MDLVEEIRIEKRPTAIRIMELSNNNIDQLEKKNREERRKWDKLVWQQTTGPPQATAQGERERTPSAQRTSE